MDKINPIRLDVHIQPNASQNKIVGYADGVLKVRIAAPPVEGKANRKLIEFLSEVLDTAKSNIVLESGLTGKRKVISVAGLYPEKLREHLERQIR